MHFLTDENKNPDLQCESDDTTNNTFCLSK